MKQATIKKGHRKEIFLPSRFTDLPVTPLYDKSKTPPEYIGRFSSPFATQNVCIYHEGEKYDIVSEDETTVLLRHSHHKNIQVQFLKTEIEDIK